MDLDLDLDIARLHAAYAEGLSPVDVVRSVYRRITAADDPGIFIATVEQEAALAAAGALGAFDPAARPLWGVPFAVKDNIDVAGMETTAACPAFAYVAEASAPCVDLLLAAGAILIGKTNLDQFATGLVGVRSPYPIPRNAMDASLVPGGSSSGSAVAVARGLVSFALGTDTAGSGRVPAGLNNIVGLKPSLGAISTRGVVPACRTLDCVSVFALTVDDAWKAFAVMAKPDARDAFSRPLALGGIHAAPSLRVGIPSATSLEFFGDDEAARSFEAHGRSLAALGAQLIEIDLAPFLEVAALLYSGPWVAERYQAIRAFIETQADAMHPVTRQIIAGAARQSAADAFAGLYRLAELKRWTAPVWREIDILAVPTMPTLYTLADLEREPVLANSRLGTYTNFVNLLDLCALAVPGRFRDDGRPAGITLIAERGRDGLLAGLGERFHAQAEVALGATGRPLAKAPARAITAPPGWIEIAVVGAHMSGLALNHQLASRGGVFLRKTATAPCYRLFALSGDEPRRPGLLRVEEGRGAAIEVEVWALPVEAAGAFLADVPPPLCIGTLLLADGTSPKGFTVEAAGTVGARDISDHGGWRAYLAATAKERPATA
jgi:allophanate hydrolase